MRKNDNRLVKFTAFVLLLTIIAVSLVSGTFAKYTSTATGSDTATVAKWSIVLNDDEEMATTTPATVTFDLFNTVKDTDATSTETDVATVDGKTLIAPGTSGAFELKIENKSEVTAQYSIVFDVDNTAIPLEFKVGDGEWTEGSITAVAAADATKLAAKSGVATVNVQWRWVYEATENADTANTADTALGIAAQTTAPTVTVEATITATQVD